MNTIKYPMLIAVLVAMAFCGFGCTKQKAAIDPKQYFAYPKATFVMKVGGDTATEPAAGNYLRLDTESSEVRFGGGHENDGAGLHWELASRTSRGDVYVISIKRRGAKEEFLPILFSGTPQTIVNTADLHLELLPEPPSKKK